MSDELFKQVGVIPYRIRSGLGDYNHVTIYIRAIDVALLGEVEAVTTHVFGMLMENEKDKWGNDLGRPSPTARVLRKLVEQRGFNRVREEFAKKLVFECLLKGKKDDNSSSS